MLCPRVSAPLWIAVLAVGVLLGACRATVADEASWPQFHGPNRDNISAETGLMKTWLEGGPKLLLTATGLGHGFGSPAIVDGGIYLSGNIDGRTVITALDSGGQIVWRFDSGRSWEEPKPGARGTPTLDDGRLYHESPHGDLVCLDAETGEKIWGINILDEFDSQNINWGLAESVLLDGENVICKPGGPETALVALDKRSGRVVWKSPSASGDLAGYASCTLAEQGGLRILLTLTAKALIGVDADSGQLLFRHGRETPWDESIAMPIFHDGQIFVSTRSVGSELFKLNVNGKKAAVAPVWRNEDFDNQHGGVVLLDGYLYGSCHVNYAGRTVCVDWRSGRELWAERRGRRGSLTAAEGMLYALDERGRVSLVPAVPDEYRVVCEFSIPKGGEGPTWAHPVVCGGRLYIRHSDFLYVYDIRAE